MLGGGIRAGIRRQNCGGKAAETSGESRLELNCSMASNFYLPSTLHYKLSLIAGIATDSFVVCGGTLAEIRQERYLAIYLAYPRMRLMFVSVSASCFPPTKSYSNAAPRQQHPISTIADGRGKRGY